MKCRPGWYFICLAIYLTTIDDNFICIPFIDLAIFSIQWSKSGVEVPTDQVPCKTIGISNLHCALHTHMLTNAKSVLTFEIGVKYTFFKGKFSEEFKYATNFLLDNKLKIETAETLNYIEIKRIMIFSALYLCIAKQLFLTSSHVLKAHIVLNLSDVVL